MKPRLYFDEPEGVTTCLFSGSCFRRYPITVDVVFHAIDAGCQVSVNASYIKPVTYLGAPKKGPEATKWHEACDSAVATVVGCLKESLA